MHSLRTFVALSIVTLVTACAAPGAGMPETRSTVTTPMAAGTKGSMAAMDPRMKAMQEMHHKMRDAGSSAEREALMAEHMKAMQGGMTMMREMHAGMGMGMGGSGMGGPGMGGPGMMGSTGGAAPMSGMGGGQGMPADMAGRQTMMTDHMAMMQTMMDMMAQRMPGAAGK